MIRVLSTSDSLTALRTRVDILAANGPPVLDAVLHPILGVGVPGPDGALVRAVSVLESANGGGTLMRGRVSKEGRAESISSLRSVKDLHADSSAPVFL